MLTRMANENAAKWLGGTSWQDLGSVDGGVPCDTFLSGSYGVNQDGSLAVGLLWLPQVCQANAGNGISSMAARRPFFPCFSMAPPPAPTQSTPMEA